MKIKSLRMNLQCKKKKAKFVTKVHEVIVNLTFDCVNSQVKIKVKRNPSRKWKIFYKQNIKFGILL